jgi:hypothetical protein
MLIPAIFFNLQPSSPQPEDCRSCAKFNHSIKSLIQTCQLLLESNSSLNQAQWHFPELWLSETASGLPDQHLLDLNCSAKLLDEAMQVEDMNLQKLVAIRSGKQSLSFDVALTTFLTTYVIKIGLPELSR